MDLPSYKQVLEISELDGLCVGVCSGLMTKHPLWERFVLDPNKRKCQKYIGLKNFVSDYIMKRDSLYTTRRQSTKATPEPSMTDQRQEEEQSSSQMSFK